MIHKILDKFEKWLYKKETISLKELNNRLEFQAVYNDDKFTDVSNEVPYYVETPSGYSKIKKSWKTIPFKTYKLTLETTQELICADTHFVMDELGNKKYIKDLKQSDRIQTKYGSLFVRSCKDLNKYEFMCDLELDDSNHVYYTNDILSHNTTTVAGYLLHYVLFSEDKSVAILANKAATSREILDRIQIMYEYLPFWLQPGVKEWNKGNIVLGNGSKIECGSTSSSSIRGKSFNCVYLDEFAHIDNADNFYESTYPVISSGKDSKVIITSTPNGLNLFYKIWKGAKDKSNGYIPIQVDWWEVPHYTEEWKEATIENIGEKKFNQEYGNKFYGSSNTLLSGEFLEKMVWNEPISETNTLKVYEEPNPNNLYVCVVDPSEGRDLDYSVINIFDVSKFPYTQVCVFRCNSISNLLLPKRIVELAERYNNAYVLIETNSIGQSIGSEVFYEYEYENIVMSYIKYEQVVLSSGGGKIKDYGIRTTKKTKRTGCSNLKVLLESDLIKINDFTTTQELSTFVSKGSSYEADKGKTDDIVMTLVIFAWFTTQSYFKDLFELNVNKEVVKQDDELCIGYYHNPAEDLESETHYL
jgi:hypothetical protein